MADATGQLTSFYQSPELIRAQQASQNAQQTAGNYASAASLLPAKLKDAIQEKLDYNKDLIEQKNRAMSEYFQAPSAARTKYENIWNPMQREALVAKERAQSYQPYANLVDILGQRMGNINDVIGSATGAFGGAVNQANTEAQLAQQNYQNLFTTADRMAQARQNEMQLNKPTGGGSGFDLNSLGELIAAMTGKPSGSDLPEVKPDYNPTQGSIFSSGLSKVKGKEVQWNSPEGYWTWDYQNQDWVPIVD